MYRAETVGRSRCNCSFSVWTESALRISIQFFGSAVATLPFPEMSMGTRIFQYVIFTHCISCIWFKTKEFSKVEQRTDLSSGFWSDWHFIVIYSINKMPSSSVLYLSRAELSSSSLWVSVALPSLDRVSILFIMTSSMSLIFLSTPRDSGPPSTEKHTKRDSTR